MGFNFNAEKGVLYMPSTRYVQILFLFFLSLVLIYPPPSAAAWNNWGEIADQMERSPADLFMTVDGGVLNSAKVAGILQPTTSPVIDAAVPAHLRDKESY
jgi:hypothetical protein